MASDVASGGFYRVRHVTLVPRTRGCVVRLIGAVCCVAMTAFLYRPPSWRPSLSGQARCRWRTTRSRPLLPWASPVVVATTVASAVASPAARPVAERLVKARRPFSAAASPPWPLPRQLAAHHVASLSPVLDHAAPAASGRVAALVPALAPALAAGGPRLHQRRCLPKEAPRSASARHWPGMRRRLWLRHQRMSRTRAAKTRLSHHRHRPVLLARIMAALPVRRHEQPARGRRPCTSRKAPARSTVGLSPTPSPCRRQLWRRTRQRRMLLCSRSCTTSWPAWRSLARRTLPAPRVEGWCTSQSHLVRPNLHRLRRATMRRMFQLRWAPGPALQRQQPYRKALQRRALCPPRTTPARHQRQHVLLCPRQQFPLRKPRQLLVQLQQPRRRQRRQQQHQLYWVRRVWPHHLSLHRRHRFHRSRLKPIFSRAVLMVA